MNVATTTTANTASSSVAMAKLNNNIAEDDNERTNTKMQSAMASQVQQQLKSQQMSINETHASKQHNNGSHNQFDTVNLNKNIAITISRISTNNNDSKHSCTLDTLQQIERDPAVRFTLEQLVAKIVAVLDKSSNRQQEQAHHDAAITDNQLDRQATSQSAEICPSSEATSVLDPLHSDTILIERNVSLSPDEASGDLVIDSDLPSSAGQQETSDETDTQQVDSSSHDEKDKSPTEEEKTGTSTQLDSPSVAPVLTPKNHEQSLTRASPTKSPDHHPGLNESSASHSPTKSPVQSPSTLLRPATKITGSSGTSLLRNVQVDSATAVAPDSPQDEREKDIVALRKLEITPPPQPASSETSDKGVESSASSAQQQPATSSQRGAKRKKSTSNSRSGQVKKEMTNDDSITDTGGRAKRQRTQTKLFQAGDVSFDEDFDESPADSIKKPRVSKPTLKSRRSSTVPSQSPVEQHHDVSSPEIVQRTDDQQDVIFYEKNDYLAIRNEQNTYYLCQLMENVRSNRPMIRVKWLDTNDSGKTYYLTSQFDRIPQKSIIMPVTPNKLKTGKKGDQFFSLDDQVKDNIMDRLKRSISVVSSSQETVTNES